ncbi:MAG: hypothetical protein IH609_11685 [Dehalococcoidia bacterium]|nr:hypothetical protein [Dehalococcoidia bacterium]
MLAVVDSAQPAPQIPRSSTGRPVEARNEPIVSASGLAARTSASSSSLLRSFHSAKGLEFGVVIMLGLDEGEMPRWSARTDAEIAEARRLFYVGVTSARSEVVLLHSGFTVDPYGRQHHDGPSRFL